MCQQTELLIGIAVYGILVAVMLPPFQVYFKHTGWPDWLAIPLSFVAAVLVCAVLFFGFIGASVLSEWWHERRKARKRQAFNESANASSPTQGNEEEQCP